MPLPRIRRFALALTFVYVFHAPASALSEDDIETFLRGEFGEVSQINIISEELEWSGKNLTTVRFWWGKEGKIGNIAFDQEGVPQRDGGTALRDANFNARRHLVGALSDEMLALLAEDPGGLVDVGLWLATYEPDPTATDDQEERQRILDEAAWSRDEARACIIDEFASRGLDDLQVERNAPIAFASLTGDELFEIADSPCIAAIYPARPNSNEFIPAPDCPRSDPGHTWFSWDSPYRNTVGLNSVTQNGAGQKICFIEATAPTGYPGTVISGTFCGTGTTSRHADLMAGLARSSIAPYGAAPGAAIYVGAFHDCTYAGVLSFCRTTANAKIWNISNDMDGLAINWRLTDYWARMANPPFIAISSGQPHGLLGLGSDTCVGEYATMSTRYVVASQVWNALTVGGSNECGTATTTDDWVWNHSWDLNPPNGRELPHLVAPAKWVQQLDCDPTSGTSNSADIVSSVAAVITQAFPGIATWPEAMRSVLMVSAKENMHTHTTLPAPPDQQLILTDGVDDRDGAGEVNALVALVPAANKLDGGNSPSLAGWDAGTIAQATTPVGSYYSEIYSASHFANGGRLRVVLSWGATASCTNQSNPSSCSSTVNDADLDLVVIDHAGGTPVFSSSRIDNYEIVELPTTSGHTYDIRIQAHSWTATSTRFGIAWLQWDLGT